MAWTDSSSIALVLHERGINIMLGNLRLQRPSLFNFGTELFVANPGLLCRRITADSAVISRENPLIEQEHRWPIPGSDGLYGLDYCIQIVDLRFDLHPRDAIALPPEIPNLPAQRFAIAATVCLGIGCPDVAAQEQAGNLVATSKERKQSEQQRNPPSVSLNTNVKCFCLKLFAIAHVDTVDPSGDPQLAYRLDQLEIVDIAPTDVENALECLLSLVLRVGVLPKMRQRLETLLLELPGYANFEIELAPVSATIPFNPAIERDQLRLFVNVRIA